MISALDTSVLLDVFLPDPLFLQNSRQAIEEAAREGQLMICEPVYAELASQFSSASRFDSVLEEIGIEVEPVGRSGAFLAGQAFKAYRKAGGKRERIITDFLIGGHAQSRAGCLVTRDRGFYRKYFKGLAILDPSQRG